MPTSLALVASVAALALGGCGTSSSGSGAPSPGSTAPRMVGGACTTEGELVCALDAMQHPGADALACKAGQWSLAFSCPSGVACATEVGHTSVLCGTTSLTPVGAACSPPNAAACAPDLSAVTICTSGTWLAAHHCSPTTCRFVPGSDGLAHAQCGDDDSYSAGDACTFPPGHGVCSTDHTAILACEGGVAKVLAACQAPTTCAHATVDGGPAVECL